ncbi:zf-HC2 domain-containing protein [Streptomyces marincola]|uniref:zf-HC2 domain-containing protein n=1 Tax=Streptomyces marincola TaxID=2878388 RepID=UPI0021004F19|nr:zf-HC2 domain-containing protein [Streptomyces marincola]
MPGPRPSAAREAAAGEHREVVALLGAWALDACAPEETERVEAHLGDCGRCAEEALGLRDAATLLEPRRSLDLDPGLRHEVLDACLARRPAARPVPSWAEPFDAEAARLDALLHDMAEEEWRTPVSLHWFTGDRWADRHTTVAGVVAGMLGTDRVLARAVGLAGPEPTAGRESAAGAEETVAGGADGRCPAWLPWREQTRALVRTAADLGGRTGERTLPRAVLGDPGRFPGDGPRVALSDAYLDRAFACWVHACDIADAVEYPYEPPHGPHLRLLVDLQARRLPGSIAGRRRAGLAVSPPRLTAAGSPGRTLHLEVEGAGGGHWYIPLDSPVAGVSRRQAREAVAHVALDDVVFCRLAAGRITPEEAASGVEGDPAVIEDLLLAAAALSRP